MKAAKIPTKTELARKYKMSLPTFRKNLVKVPDIDPDKRKFTPIEIERIYNHMGRP